MTALERRKITRRDVLKGGAAAAIVALAGDTLKTNMEGMNPKKEPNILERGFEKLSDIKSLDFNDISKRRLEKIGEEQKDPQASRYVFCLNHVQPHIPWRKEKGLAMDFPVFDKVLREAGVMKTHPFSAADVDMKITGPLSKMQYDAIHKVFSKVGETFIDSVPAAVNRYEPKTTQRHNVPHVLKMISILEKKEGNIAIYPFGTWEASGDQDMSEETAMPKGEFLKPHVAKGEPGFDEWMHALKRGAFMVSRVADAPIIPVYVEDNDGHWIVRVGETIRPSAEDKGDREKALKGEEVMAKRYLEEMRAMQEECKKIREQENS